MQNMHFVHHMVHVTAAQFMSLISYIIAHKLLGKLITCFIMTTLVEQLQVNKSNTVTILSALSLSQCRV